MINFTTNTSAGLSAIIAELPDHYHADISAADMTRLLQTLDGVYSTEDLHTVPFGDGCPEGECNACWAGNFVQTIALTLGIDLV